MATPIQPAQGKQKKIDQFQDIKTKLEKSKAVIFSDPSGLTHKQLEELRKTLKKTNAEFTITKNTLLKRALTETKKTVNDDSLQGSTASLFAYGDEASPVKALTQFLKTANIGKIKSGILGSTELSESDINRLASLPPREMLLSKLVGQLQAPLYGLHNALSWNIRKFVWTISAISDKQQVTSNK